MHKIYVIGHRQPDTDCTCSVLGYTEFLNIRSPGVYIAARCGELNAETRFVLSRFQAEPPVLLESVEPNVSDLPFTYVQSARRDMPTIDVAEMMAGSDMRNMPITGDEGRFLGLVSEYGLANAYVKRETGPLEIPGIDVTVLARILDAELVVKARDRLRGQVYIAIDALHVALSRLTSDDVAVVGDNEPSQLALISAGIAALIVADGAPVGERVITAAKAREVSIMATPLDAFGVGKMIHLSLPAGQVMATDVPVVRGEDTLEYAKRLVANSRYRTACVVREDGTLSGMISRNSLLDEVQKSVILLDHNEYAQAVDGIEKAEILEIIDHHRLGAISTLKPVRFLNEPVGSTSTIVTGMFMEEEITPSGNTAGLLLAGILSDTLVLKMSTTTRKDEEAVGYLAGLTGLDPVAFGTELLREGMDLDRLPLTELLTQDTKRYTLSGKDVVIAQVMVASTAYAATHAEEIRQVLESLRKAHGADLYLVLFTNVIGNASELFAAGDHGTLQSLGYAAQPLELSGVMSRKKDFLPAFGAQLRNL